MTNGTKPIETTMAEAAFPSHVGDIVALRSALDLNDVVVPKDYHVEITDIFVDGTRFAVRIPAPFNIHMSIDADLVYRTGAVSSAIKVIHHGKWIINLQKDKFFFNQWSWSLSLFHSPKNIRFCGNGNSAENAEQNALAQIARIP